MSAQQRARLDQLLSEIIEFGNEVKGIPRTGQINPGDQPEPLPSAPLDQAAFHLRESESVIGGCERVLRAVRSELFGRDDISGI